MMKDKKNTRTQITEKTFNAVKIMLAGGATHAEVAEYLHIGVSTVGRIKSAADWQEYKNILAAMFSERKKHSDKQKEKEEVKQEEKNVCPDRQTIIVQASHYMLEEQKKTNELLVNISNKLAFIVEQLS